MHLMRCRPCLAATQTLFLLILGCHIRVAKILCLQFTNVKSLRLCPRLGAQLHPPACVFNDPTTQESKLLSNLALPSQVSLSLPSEPLSPLCSLISCPLHCRLYFPSLPLPSIWRIDTLAACLELLSPIETWSPHTMPTRNPCPLAPRVLMSAKLK